MSCLVVERFLGKKVNPKYATNFVRSAILRLHALWLLRSGQRTERHVAEVLSVHVRTVEKWVQGYRQGGLARVRETKPRVGARPKLSVDQQHALRVHVQEHPPKTAHEMRAWVEQEWKITYHPKAWYVTVHRLGLRKKVPRPRSDKASDEAQEAWKKNLSSSLQVVNEDGKGLGFANEMRPGLHGQVHRRWGVRGTKIVQKVQCVYVWTYLALAVNGLEGTVHWKWVTSMRANDLLPVLQEWKQQGVRSIVWDGAPSHRTRKVADIGLNLIRLPPYSPELNPAERVFQELRRPIEGELYASLEEKMALVDAWLTDFAASPKRIRQLCGWHWIRDAIDSTTNWGSN